MGIVQWVLLGIEAHALQLMYRELKFANFLNPFLKRIDYN